MIHISKEGVLFKFLEIDDDDNQVEREIDVLKGGLGLVSYLSFLVTLEEGVTVEDIMKILARTPETTDYVFDSCLGGYSFLDFVNEMEVTVEKPTALVRMEVCHEVKDISVEDNHMYSTPRMRGLNASDEHFSVEFSELASYMKLPLSLNHEYIIRQVDDFGEEISCVSFNKGFTLFEMIHAILYEISYYGSPDMRQEAFIQLLEDNAEEIAGDTEDLDSLQEDLQKLVAVEDYEAAARVRDRIRQMNEKTKPGTN